MTLEILLSTLRCGVSPHLYQNLLLEAFQVQCFRTERNAPESLFGPKASSLEILGKGEDYWARFHIHMSDMNPLLVIEIGEFTRLYEGKLVSRWHEQARFEIASKVQLSLFDQTKVRTNGGCRVSGVNGDAIMGRGLFLIGADATLLDKYPMEMSGHETMSLLDDKKRLWQEILLPERGH